MPGKCVRFTGGSQNGFVQHCLAGGKLENAGMGVQYEVTTDASRFDIELILETLRGFYWAHNQPREVLEKSIRHALCFGAFAGTEQVGFARVITDYSTFAYLSDVFVVAAHRGRGVSKLLMREIMAHPELQGLRRFLLITKDAHGLYAQFGFKPLANPQEFMTVHDPNVYGQEERCS